MNKKVLVGFEEYKSLLKLRENATSNNNNTVNDNDLNSLSNNEIKRILEENSQLLKNKKIDDPQKVKIESYLLSNLNRIQEENRKNYADLVKKLKVLNSYRDVKINPENKLEDFNKTNIADASDDDDDEKFHSIINGNNSITATTAEATPQRFIPNNDNTIYPSKSNQINKKQINLKTSTPKNISHNFNFGSDNDDETGNENVDDVSMREIVFSPMPSPFIVKPPQQSSSSSFTTPKSVRFNLNTLKGSQPPSIRTNFNWENEKYDDNDDDNDMNDIRKKQVDSFNKKFKERSTSKDNYYHHLHSPHNSQKKKSSLKKKDDNHKSVDDIISNMDQEDIAEIGEDGWEDGDENNENDDDDDVIPSKSDNEKKRNRENMMKSFNDTSVLFHQNKRKKKSINPYSPPSQSKAEPIRKLTLIRRGNKWIKAPRIEKLKLVKRFGVNYYPTRFQKKKGAVWMKDYQFSSPQTRNTTRKNK